MTEHHYVGSELDLFSQAHNWKRYWSSIVVPYLAGQVLDVGAGLGATIAMLATQRPDVQWTALEPDPALVARMQQALREGRLPPSTHIIQGVAADITASPQFDTILYVDVLEHIQDDNKEVAIAKRLLRPGGHLVVVAPAHNWLYSPFDRAIGHHRRYSKASLLTALDASLEILCVRYLDSIGMLASLANRLLLKSAAPTPAQIAFWDKLLVPASRIADPLFGGTLGKSLIAVAKLPASR